MAKYIQRTAKMDLKRIGGMSLLLLGLVGCSRQYTWWEASESPTEEIVYRDDVDMQVATPVVPCETGKVEPVVVPPVEEDDEFIDYRRTSAEYRSFGERTPMDHRYTAGGAGNNMSAAIPPTIDDEVSDYETAVNVAFENAESDNGDSVGMDSGDEAVEDWLAEEGNTLRGLLTEWCERAGWRLIWNSNRNYTLSAGAMFRGRFADVASALIRSFARARPAPLATFFKGNRVLVVETKEDENAYN